jgi:hypothetical protein
MDLISQLQHKKLFFVMFRLIMKGKLIKNHVRFVTNVFQDLLLCSSTVLGRF